MQRADSAARLNPHLHTLAFDGVYVRDEHGVLQFHPLGEPTPVISVLRAGGEADGSP